jgi:hypothetical protein
LRSVSCSSSVCSSLERFYFAGMVRSVAALDQSPDMKGSCCANAVIGPPV